MEVMDCATNPLAHVPAMQVLLDSRVTYQGALLALRSIVRAMAGAAVKSVTARWGGREKHAKNKSAPWVV